jgi:hypothetical protein
MADVSNAESVPAHEPVAQDAQTLTDALKAFDEAGYTSQFKVLEFARVQCLTCREEFAAHEVAMESLRRLEGASDPADMLAVVALTCPRCAAQGTLILNYGPDASLEESQLLLALQDDRPTPA